MVKKQIIIDSKVVAYYLMGNEKGTPILMLHGFRGNHGGLSDFARSFDTFSVVLIDLPGYGASQALDGNHDFQAYAVLLEKFCTLVGLKKVILVGHSFGASLAMVFAAKYPKRVLKLVLIAPVTNANTFEARLGKAYYHLALFMPDILRTRWLKSRIIDYLTDMVLLKTSSSKRRQHVIAANQRNLSELNEKVVIDNFLSFYSTNMHILARRIGIKTHIIVGEADRISPLVSIAILKDELRNSTIEIIPKAGHLVPLEHPSLVGRRVLRFLESH